MQTPKTYKILISGIVQGVGFRPFIHNIAHQNKISGSVLNNSSHVEIIAQANKNSLTKFISLIREKAPPLAKIKNISVTEIESDSTYNTFEIKQSRSLKERNIFISPDQALCQDCLEELLDPENRRYLYPYINCTNCGPRYTIISDLPYDRDSTTMKDFSMCPECSAEYKNPANRRFHAQPDACFNCGPITELIDNSGKLIRQGQDSESTTKIFLTIAELLAAGKILGIKGIGGFHIVCDASNEKAVQELRKRKTRPHKPFAIMLPQVKDIRNFVHLSPSEEASITGSARPIVLLQKKEHSGFGANIADSVAPNNRHLGIMLPYTPVHHLLFHFLSSPLVMTSANISDEPIIIDNTRAINDLKEVCDYFVTGNRGILIACDDSVLQIRGADQFIIRRSRGFVPDTINLEQPVAAQILALGAEQKNTICFVKDSSAVLSHHLGDLKTFDSFNAFKSAIRHFYKLYRIKPDVLAFDLHPEYLSSRFAQEIPEEFDFLKKAETIPIQHHHAHAVSCMSENRIEGKTIAVVLDGSGYGPDGTIWGGEILLADSTSFKRAAYLSPVPLPGGESAIKHPWKMAISYLYAVYGKNWKSVIPAAFCNISEKDLDLVIYQIQNNLNSPVTTSCGRLFDAVAALCGVGMDISYEGQAAIEFENLIDFNYNSESGYTINIIKSKDKYIIDTHPMIIKIINELRSSLKIGIIAYKMHQGLAAGLADLCKTIADTSSIKNVLLSGGCFMNKILTKFLKNFLERNGLIVYTHKSVPCNDGGISLGQTIIANNIYKRGL